MNIQILIRRPFSKHPDDNHLSFILTKDNDSGEYVTFLDNSGALYEGHYYQKFFQAFKDFKKRK